MRNIYFTCDHCGKKLNEMNDFTEMKIDNFIDFITTDLCSDCFRELNEMVLKYINKKQCK